MPNYQMTIGSSFYPISLQPLMPMDRHVSSQLQALPNVHELISALSASSQLADVPLLRIKFCIRRYLNQLRQTILSGGAPAFLLSDHNRLICDLTAYIQLYHRPSFSRVINGTGVIIHTNLGRSLLPTTAVESIASAGRWFSNLELDLVTGKRGSRYQHVDALLCELTGAESALVVNNNAAAVLIALETLAKGKEVIVSRGQLVEIGGSFRIPDLMSRSGARLVEVGTTNRTHVQDYQAAITAETGLLLRVHCSNFRIIGFTSEVADAELVRLGLAAGIPVMEDLGSGCFVDLSRYGLDREPCVQDVVASGMDVVTFSGDKLLGGPQAGIIVGKKRYLDQIKSNPLNRALRIDKLTLAALEAVLRKYLDPNQALREIPTLAMIAAPLDTLEQRARICLEQWVWTDEQLCECSVVRTAAQVGGGAMPGQSLDSWAVAVRPLVCTTSLLEKRLRQAPCPVMGRIEEDRLLLDMRTIADDEIELLIASLRSALHQDENDRIDQSTTP